MFILGLSVGIVTGILLSILNQILFLRFRSQIERVEKQAQSALKEKGAILVDNSKEIERLLDVKYE